MELVDDIPTGSARPTQAAAAPLKKAAAKVRGHSHGLLRIKGLDGLYETLGEECRNLFLTEVESRLKGMLRSSDKLVRLSTEKYCLVLRGVEQKSHVELAVAKLLRALEAPVDVVGDKVFIEFNLGFAWPSKAANSKRMLQTAEAALRISRTSGQSSVIFGVDQQDGESKPDPSLLPRIEEALEQGEFALYYQPKIDAAFGRVVGAEGLIRWLDAKNKKVISPGSFIEIAEQSAIIKPITESMLRIAVARCVGWQDPLSVAVNIPPVMLDTGALVSVVEDTLDFFELSAARLTLEITERGELPDRALAHLQALRDIGVKISIDDFGTGQCSLSYFRDLPADQVKIDQSFVGAMNTSRKDMSIVRGCIDLAHHCEMEVVAEGVEDQQTADALKELGCDVLQGYLFGHPEAANDFENNHLRGLATSDDGIDHFSHLLDE